MTPRFIRDTAILVALAVTAAVAFAVGGQELAGGLVAAGAIAAAVGLMAATGWPGEERSPALIRSRVREDGAQTGRPLRVVPASREEREEDRRAA